MSRATLWILGCLWLAANLSLAQDASSTATPDKLPQDHREVSQRLLSVRRIYVEPFKGGETADQIRDMIISELQRSKLFVLTENPETADAILRGSAEDLVYTETHESREDADVRGSISIYRSEPTSNARYTNRRGISASTGVGSGEFQRSVERRHEAVAAVRLVNRHGDVLWATTKESKGAKLRGASSHVAFLVARQLMEDYQRLVEEMGRALTNPSTSGGAPADQAARPVSPQPSP